MVVTDDQGRYVIPDLPAVNYSVCVRGYGLVDSPKMRAKPGQHLDLTAVPAPNAAAAAHYYPAIYWYSMLKMPPESELGGNAYTMIPELADGRLAPTDEEHRLHRLPPDRPGGDAHDSGAVRSVQDRRRGLDAAPAIRSGRRGDGHRGRIFGGAPFKYLGDWTDRIAKGELPKSKPPRPQGVERNVVDHDLGMGHRKDLHARLDFLGSAQSDGQCQWSAVRLARICQRRHADP